MKIVFLKLNKLTADKKDLARNAILNVTNLISKTVNINNLRTIFITSDFSIDLIKFQKRTRNRIGYTKNNSVDLMGKTISIYKEDSIDQFIFLNELIPLGLLSQIPQYFAHMLHHEFGHITDDLINFNYFKRDLTIINEYTIENLLNAHSACNWGEFYATFISYSTMPQKGDFEFNFELNDLENSTIDSSNRLNREKFNYQTRKIDLDTFFGILEKETNFIFNRISRTIGYIVASELNQKNTLANEITKDLMNILQSTQYGKVLNELIIAFYIHLKEYKKWDLTDPFKENRKVIIKLWENFGIKVSNQESGIKIEIK